MEILDSMTKEISGEMIKKIMDILKFIIKLEIKTEGKEKLINLFCNELKFSFKAFIMHEKMLKEEKDVQHDITTYTYGVKDDKQG